MKEKRLLIKNITSLGVVQIVNYAFPLITIPFVSRILGPSSLGTINYINAFIVYFTVLVGYGFDYSATRKISANYNDIKNRDLVFSEVISARLLLLTLSVLIFICCIFTVPILRENSLLSFLIFFNVVAVFLSPYYIFQGLQNLSLYSFVNLIRGGLSTLLILLLIRKKDDYIIYAAITVLLNLLSSIYFFCYAFFKYKIAFKFLSIKHSIKLLVEDRYIFFSSIIWSLYTSTNTVILGFFVNTEEVAYYTVAVGFINIVQSITNIPITTSLYPFLGNSLSNDKEQGLSYLRIITPIIFYFTFLCGLFIFIFSSFIIKIVYGEQFMNSVVCLMILSFMPLASCMVNLLGIQVMYNLKMDRAFVKITFIGAIASIILNLIFCYYFGYIGPCIVLVLTEIFILFKTYFKLTKMGINIIDKDNFKPSFVKNNIQSILRK